MVIPGVPAFDINTLPKYFEKIINDKLKEYVCMVIATRMMYQSLLVKLLSIYTIQN